MGDNPFHFPVPANKHTAHTRVQCELCADWMLALSNVLDQTISNELGE